jgi:hypothetical protein
MVGYGKSLVGGEKFLPRKTHDVLAFTMAMRMGALRGMKARI